MSNEEMTPAEKYKASMKRHKSSGVNHKLQMRNGLMLERLNLLMVLDLLMRPERREEDC